MSDTSRGETNLEQHKSKSKTKIFMWKFIMVTLSENGLFSKKNILICFGSKLKFSDKLIGRQR